jgi:hypothetical protein
VLVIRERFLLAPIALAPLIRLLVVFILVALALFCRWCIGLPLDLRNNLQWNGRRSTHIHLNVRAGQARSAVSAEQVRSANNVWTAGSLSK